MERLRQLEAHAAVQQQQQLQAADERINGLQGENATLTDRLRQANGGGAPLPLSSPYLPLPSPFLPLSLPFPSS